VRPAANSHAAARPALAFALTARLLEGQHDCCISALEVQLHVGLKKVNDDYHVDGKEEQAETQKMKHSIQDRDYERRRPSPTGS
jgi:hypothetical protein